MRGALLTSNCYKPSPPKQSHTSQILLLQVIRLLLRRQLLLITRLSLAHRKEEKAERFSKRIFGSSSVFARRITDFQLLQTFRAEAISYIAHLAFTGYKIASAPAVIITLQSYPWRISMTKTEASQRWNRNAVIPPITIMIY